MISPSKVILNLFLFLVIRSVSFGQNHEWGNVPIGGGGFVSAIIPSKDVDGLMYARTDVGGAYRWSVVEQKWESLLDWVSDDEVGFLGVESLALDPSDEATIYMSVGISYFNNGKSAILKSTDYGATFSIIDITNQFKVHGNGMGRQTGEKLVVDPVNSNILYCGTRWNGLFKSIDGATSWTKVTAFNPSATPNENGISMVVLDPSTATSATQRLFVGMSQTGTNLYISNDAGNSFTPISGGPANFMPQRGVIAGDNLFITYGNGAGPHGHWAVPEPMDAGGVWKYHIPTDQWTDVTPSGFSSAFGGIDIDPNNANRIVISTINTYMSQDNAWGDRVLLSTNGGSSWTDVMANGVDVLPNGVTWIDGHAIHWAGSIVFNPFDTDEVWVTSGNGVFRNEAISVSPSNWIFEVKGLEETVPLDIESIKDGPLVTVIGDYDGFVHADVTDYAPILTPRMGTTTGLDIADQNSDVQLRVGNEMYYSLDGGLNWQQCTIKGAKGRVAVSADGSVFMHSPEQSATTYRSTDRGSSWTTVNGMSFSEPKPTADPIQSFVFYAYDPSSGSFLKSTDGGINFSQQSNAGTNGSKIIRVNPKASGDVWLPMYWGGLKHSLDGGSTFSTISGVSYCAAVGLGKAFEESAYPSVFIWGTVNGQRGLFRSVDKGQSWLRINDDEHEYGGPGNGQFVVGDWNEFGRVYMSTAGRGLVTGALDGTDCSVYPNHLDCTLTGVSEEESVLINAFPNPFTDEFTLNVASFSNYTVVDSQGIQLLQGQCKDRCEIGSELPKGLFYIHITSLEGVRAVPLLKN